MICPECQGGTRVHKVFGPERVRECLNCRRRFRTIEKLMYEIGGQVTKERLLQVMQERFKPQSFAALAEHFCVSKSAVAHALKKLESEGHVKYELRDRKKYWSPTIERVRPQPASKPKAKPKSVAVPAARIHRIEDGEERTAVKRNAPAPVQPQSWFSVLG